MITIVYTVSSEKKDAEISWLRDQKIFPSSMEVFNWELQKYNVRIGAIVTPEQANLIKLRNNVEVQSTYKQR